MCWCAKSSAIRSVRSFTPNRSACPVSKPLASYLETWMKRGKLKKTHPVASAQCLFGMLWYFLQSQELMGGKELTPLSDETICSTVSKIFLSGTSAEP